MKLLLSTVVLSLLFPLACFAPSKEIVQLQRDMALLQDQVRTMQRAFDEKMAALTVLVEQTLDRVNKANTAVAVLESTVRDRLREQEKTLVAPVAGVSSKVDQMSDEFRFVREAIADMNSRVGKLQAQVVDLGNAVKIMQAPPPPPGESSVPAPSGVSAQALFSNAQRDQLGGNLDLALQQYQDYLRYFGNTDLAPVAQYSVGEIHYNKGDFDAALKAFDLVLERYPENQKTPDAMYMKGMALLKAGQRTAAAQEFRELLKRYPSGSLANRATAELKRLGYSATPPSSKKRR